MATATKPKPRLSPRPSGTTGPEESKEKAKKGTVTKKPKTNPKKKVEIKRPCRPTIVRELAFHIEALDSEIDTGLAEHRRKLTKKRQRKASYDGNWANSDGIC